MAQKETAVDALDKSEAEEELNRLALILSKANAAYHTDDAPDLTVAV